MATTTTTPASTTNPLREVSRYGQSAWLDYIRRSLITGGELKRLVDEDGVGVHLHDVESGLKDVGIGDREGIGVIER
jgi:hypothetical protein